MNSREGLAWQQITARKRKDRLKGSATLPPTSVWLDLPGSKRRGAKAPRYVTEAAERCLACFVEGRKRERRALVAACLRRSQRCLLACLLACLCCCQRRSLFESTCGSPPSLIEKRENNNRRKAKRRHPERETVAC